MFWLQFLFDLSGNAVDLTGCSTVCDAVARIWPMHISYLPQEILIIDSNAGKPLSFNDSLPDRIYVVLKKLDDDGSDKARIE